MNCGNRLPGTGGDLLRLRRILLGRSLVVVALCGHGGGCRLLRWAVRVRGEGTVFARVDMDLRRVVRVEMAGFDEGFIRWGGRWRRRW